MGKTRLSEPLQGLLRASHEWVRFKNGRKVIRVVKSWSSLLPP